MMKATFIYWRSLTVSVLALAACGASASTASASSVSMPLGGHAMAPVGFTAFCARKPTQCLGVDAAAPVQAPAPVEEQAPVAAPSMATGWTLAFLKARGERDVATGALDASNSTRSFHSASRWNTDLAFAEPAYRSWGARAGVERVSMGDRAAAAEIESTASQLLPSPVAIERGQASLKLLKRVNRDINRVIVPATDEQISGSWDRWDEPLADQGDAKGAVYGDCEDYVLEKRRALIAEGVDPKSLSIAVVRSHGGDIHAVLIAATENGEYVLDNLSYWVLPWQEAPYTWVMRQVDGDARDWRVIPRLNGPVRTAALN